MKTRLPCKICFINRAFFETTDLLERIMVEIVPDFGEMDAICSFLSLVWCFVLDVLVFIHGLIEFIVGIASVLIDLHSVC